MDGSQIGMDLEESYFYPWLEMGSTLAPMRDPVMAWMIVA
jgi:hypothetical protein